MNKQLKKLKMFMKKQLQNQLKIETEKQRIKTKIKRS